MKPRWAATSSAEQFLSRWYPFGIGKITAAPVVRSDTVVFISDYEDQETSELFKKAITQGLKWELERAQLICIKRNQLKSKMDQLVAEGAAAFVLLGDDLRSELKIVTSDKSRWTTYGEMPLLVSAELRAVLTDAKVKRSFWDDLKSIAQRLEQSLH